MPRRLNHRNKIRPAQRAQKGTSSASARRKRGGLIRFLLFWSILIGGFLALGLFGYFGWKASRFDLAQIDQMPQRSVVYDVFGKEYSRLYGQNRTMVKLEDVSPWFIEALLAREDTRFFHHHGFDPKGIVRAAIKNVMNRSVKEGASTLTQQLARNSYPLGGQNLKRKLLEAALAIRIEQALSKEEILTHYINRIYYGSGLYGLETATQAYFNKPCSKLTLGEAALMAGLIRSPNRFSPFRDLEAGLKERDSVLSRMRHLGMITESEEQEAKRQTIQVNTNPPTIIQENYAMDAVYRDILLLTNADILDRGGLKIYTTIDPHLQKKSVEALEIHLREIESSKGFPHPARRADSTIEDNNGKTPYVQGAVVVIDNASGGVRALVGGRDFEQSKFNRAIQARRQIGSAFKPFVYAAAFQNGLMPGTLIDDGPIRAGEVRAASNWRPSNSDNQFLGIQPADFGLIRSRNTMSVRVGEFAGMEAVTHLGRMAGLGNDIPENPSVYLGTLETNLRDLVSAYSIFPNHGVRKQPYIIERIDDETNHPIYRAAHIEMQVLKPGAAWLTTVALKEALVSGTGASARRLGFTQPGGGKTGTTNDFRDAWFVGFTSNLTAGVWIGMDKPQPIMKSGYGSTLALPVWVKVMSAAACKKQYHALDFRAPVAMERTQLCSASGKLATNECYHSGASYTANVPADLLPNSICTVHAGRAIPPGYEQRVDSAPERLFRSVRRLFGGN